jgi:hypothetical protein
MLEWRESEVVERINEERVTMKEQVNIKKDRLIAFSTAELLSEIDFPSMNGYQYIADGDRKGKVGISNTATKYYPAPSQTQLQRWFREFHKIHIECKLFSYSETKLEYFGAVVLHRNGVGVTFVNHIDESEKKGFIYFDLMLKCVVTEDYEECMEDGLRFAIEFVKRGNKLF